MNLTQGTRRKPRGLGVDVGRKENYLDFFKIKVCFYNNVFTDNSTEMAKKGLYLLLRAKL